MTGDISHLWRINHREGDPSEPMGYYWAVSEIMARALAGNGGLGDPDELTAQRERNGQLFERIGSADLDFPHGPVLATHRIEGIEPITEFIVDESTLGGQNRSGLAEHGQRRFCVKDTIVETMTQAIVFAIALQNGATLVDAKAAGRVLMIPGDLR